MMATVTKAPLLVEMRVEELPPKALRALRDAFVKGLESELSQRGLLGESCQAQGFATPRRLAVRLSEVISVAPDRLVTHKLMPVTVGLDAQGQPTPALIKRLGALGLDASCLPQIEQKADGKAIALFVSTTVPGLSLQEGLQEALSACVAGLPIPKVMSYPLADGWAQAHFVRPVHGLLALHGSDVVAVSVLGRDATRTTVGHRFEAAAPVLSLAHAKDYETVLLEQGAVIACLDERRQNIQRQLIQAGARLGLQPIEDDALLEEVCALVERPHVLHCQFEPEFLEVPQECLILTMKANQRYFPLLDDQARLTQHFLVVSNVSPADPSRVIEGNERVIRPRLADARFFFQQDRKRTLESRVEALSRVVYHGKLGSQGERMARVRAIAAALAGSVDSPDAKNTWTPWVDRAALLAKADLLTDMVGEFPELQGVMGAYYARHDGEVAEVAQAIEDHYRPRFAGDALPRSPIGALLALADKLETLVGLFGIGQLPTGDRDPFALRRHALGVLRILSEADLGLTLDATIDRAIAAFPAHWLTHEVKGPLTGFIDDRLSVSWKDQGASSQQVEAVLALRPQALKEIPGRLAAVREFANLPEAQSLSAANKRVANILKKAGETIPDQVDRGQLIEAAELNLLDALERTEPAAQAHFSQGAYTESLKLWAALRAPVDDFFDQVMVNAEDVALRMNRLALLARLHRSMNRVADLARLA